ncbi:hypothetical protein HPP92_022550 [Vanilla planifolia]|uniref:Uncharacterized protein n=1 Tax=Vanilla planifolia TaxID=51239 RepID=A0A835PR40_VANPL|nr:hypothetical protein HPP92_022550 [Vanilla planifolia]
MACDRGSCEGGAEIGLLCWACGIGKSAAEEVGWRICGIGRERLGQRLRRRPAAARGRRPWLTSSLDAMVAAGGKTKSLFHSSSSHRGIRYIL